MKFVDEAGIRVVGGNGGGGALSFLRERHRPKGGPDGGDGGAGGGVYLAADGGLNTLADFRYTRLFRAPDGGAGAGGNRAGKSGADLIVRAPLGTLVRVADSAECIGELVTVGAKLLVARGGRGGRGNARFKSAANRTPRKTTPGGRGDARDLQLELKVLADVGLLGLPNAGKSTLLARVSAARPKIADYPFTTLHPQLGVVEVGDRADRDSFVIADIPGLIPGAARGAGLGARFLRHLARNHILLHLVDAAAGAAADLARTVRATEHELAAHDAQLLQKERWLVLNKTDLHPAARAAELARELRAELNCPAVHCISAATGAGCDALMQKLMRRLRRGFHTTASADQTPQ